MTSRKALASKSNSLGMLCSWVRIPDKITIQISASSCVLVLSFLNINDDPYLGFQRDISWPWHATNIFSQYHTHITEKKYVDTIFFRMPTIFESKVSSLERHNIWVQVWS